MRNRTKILVVAAAIASVAVVPAIASAVAGTEAGEVDVAIAGSALEQASTAALDHLGEGQVTGTEVGDEESYYEVEVTRDDGRQVDVQLDESFVVVGTEDDEVGSDDSRFGRRQAVGTVELLEPRMSHSKRARVTRARR